MARLGAFCRSSRTNNRGRHVARRRSPERRGAPSPRRDAELASASCAELRRGNKESLPTGGRRAVFELLDGHHDRDGLAPPLDDLRPMLCGLHEERQLCFGRGNAPSIAAV